MYFIDSNVWIAAGSKEDENHIKALRLLKEIYSSGEQIAVSDYVVIEVVNYLNRKIDFKSATLALDLLAQNPKVSVLMNDSVSFSQTKEEFKKLSRLSFTDANIICLMRKNNIKKLASYEPGFDSVKELQRIE